MRAGTGVCPVPEEGTLFDCGGHFWGWSWDGLVKMGKSWMVRYLF